MRLILAVNQEDFISVSALSRSERTMYSYTSKVIGQLIEEGYITTEKTKDTRSLGHLKLTKKGLELVEALLKLDEFGIIKRNDE